MVKIQEFFKALECLSSTFQGKFNFQGLFKTVLYIQVLFKPVQILYRYIYIYFFFVGGGGGVGGVSGGIVVTMTLTILMRLKYMK